MIRLEHLTKSYPTPKGRHYLFRDLNLELPSGHSIALMGLNGAGKSTLLKAAMRLLPCDTGSVHWQGVQRRDIAYLPQQSEIDRSLPITVFELAALGLWQELGFWGGVHAAQRARVHEALERVGMGAFAHASIAALSNGQFQRVLLARMLVQRARFLLLDEPFNAVDAPTTEALLAVLHQCRTEGACIVAVVHDRALAVAHFANTLLLARQVVAVGASAAVLTDAHLRQAAQFQQDHDAQPQWCMAPGVADVGVPVGQATHGPDHVHPYAHGHPHDHDHHHPHPH